MDAAAITSALGIEPTRVGSMKNGESLWILVSDCSPDRIDTEEHFRALLARLRPHWEKLLVLSKRHEPTFSCYIWRQENECFPAVVLSNETLSAIAALGGCLNIDA